MSDAAYLALHFDAPLQSWGYQSKFDRRTTLAYPTRSGVIGMLCAALGVDRSDKDGLARIDGVEVDVYVLRSGGRLTDYHTIGGGYDPSRQKGSICRTAEGKVGNTVQTKREYMEETHFGVVVSGPRTLVDELAAAIASPKWGVWLGRKSCIPAARVGEGVFATLEAALGRLCEAGGVSAPERRVKEVAVFSDGDDTLLDRPLDFATRQFAPRRVRIE